MRRKLRCRSSADVGETRLSEALHLLDHALALFDAQDRLSICNSAYRSWISVSDPGCGIPLSHHASLFQPFQRAGQGSGRIEGTVGFSSVCEQGSEFWVDMPAYPQG